MSIRNYLFLLVGSLIVLLTISQLTLIYWLEKNIDQEVNVKARQLTERVIELAFDKALPEQKIHLAPEQTVIDNIKSMHKDGDVEIITVNENEQQRVIRYRTKSIGTDNIEEFIETVNSENPKSESTENSQDKQPEQKKLRVLKKQVKSIISDIYQQPTQENIIVFEDKNLNSISTHEVIQHHWVEAESVESKSQQLIKNIRWVLILGAVGALLGAYWLSTQFSRPLSRLTAGFKRLANGDYQHKVQEQGISELRTTINHYNNMVSQLEDLSQQAQQHQEHNHLIELGEVSRGLAHTLRNPIHTIGLSIEQLTDDDIDPIHKHQLIATIQHKITHIDKSIKALLTLTTASIKRDEEVPLIAVIQDIILEVKLDQCNNITFELNVPDNITILAAESEIRSMLHTLLINACEVLTNAPVVHINVEETDQCITVNILDNGQGIDPKIEEKLFQPHVSTKPEGAGMGLYIANRIASLHYQGSLILKNRYDNAGSIIGCLATLTLAKGNHSL